ncbi:Peptidase U32 [Cymbomonas tetramitiformis]|uniref:Peptidase U32 n=1 Tax=Cymbomonas tetramitiformis TaxID=36881 RepID=A0AAE0G272_9CHLO|nr:Peptidase U32 [Cymbomonas tetramitiformis]
MRKFPIFQPAAAQDKSVAWLEEVILDFLEVQGLKEACQMVREAGKKVVVATPRVLKPDEERLWQFYLRLEADVLLVRQDAPPPPGTRP